MEFATPNVEDHTRPVTIVAKFHVMATYPVLSARNPVRSVATIRNATSYVTNLVHHVLRIVPGLVHIVDGARCRVQCPVICYHAQNAVQICWLVDIDARPFVGKSVQVSRTVRFVPTQQPREWSLTLLCHPLSRRLIWMRIPASCHHVDISSPWRAWMDT